MDKSKIKKILYIVLILLWMGVIFAFSSLGAEDSDDQSIGLSEIIVENGAKFLHQIGILQDMPTSEELNSIIEALNPLIRKCAHAVEYFVLAMLVLLALRDKDTWNLSMAKSSMIALLVCYLYSYTDEFHQTFVPGRSGQISDCINDTLGGMVAILIYLICYYTKNRRKNKQTS